MAKAKQPVSIDGIEFDALIEESQTYEAQVPEYPTEKGFSVSDTIVLKPETLTMTLYVSDTPVTWVARHRASPGRSDEIVKRLKELYYSKKVVQVVTSDEVYSDMAITNISLTKSTDTGYAREIPITLKKIVVTQTATVTIPATYGKSGTTGASAGSANTSGGSSGGNSGGSSGSKSGSSGKSGDGSKKSGGSVLYNAASGFGLI